MKKRLLTLIAIGATTLSLTCCESPEEKAKRLASEELSSLNISASQYDDQLVTEATKGSTKRIQLLLTAGADVNSSNAEGKTALIAAIQSRNFEAVKLLLEAGANIHAKNVKGETALHIAVAEGQEDIIHYLLQKGALLNDSNESGFTPLFYAIKAQNLNNIQLLINAGANINATAANGLPPLILAANYGNQDLISLLLKNGANYNKSDATGSTALNIAVQNGHTEACRQLIEAGAKIHETSPDGSTLLMLAASKGNNDIIELLLKNGADINGVNNQGTSALHVSVANSATVQYLIDKGANVNLTDHQGYSPLTLAVKQEQLETVKLLLKAHADPTLISHEGIPLIALAAQTNNVKLVQAILDTGLDATINFKHNGNNINTLSCTSSEEVRSLLKQAGCIEIISTDEAIRLLQRYKIIDTNAEGELVDTIDIFNDCWTKTYDDSLSKKAEELLYNYKLYKDGQKKLSDYYYIDQVYWLWEKGNKKLHLPNECLMAFVIAGSAMGDNTLEYAVDNGHIDIMEAMLKTGVKAGEKAILKAIEKNDKRSTELLISSATTLTSPMLTAATKKGWTDIVKTLIESPNVNVNYVDWGDGALALAARAGNIEIVKLLLTTENINVNGNPEYGRDYPLGQAIDNNRIEVAKLLLAAPNIDIHRTLGNSSLLFLAVENNNVEAVKLLLATPGVDVNKGIRWFTPLMQAVKNNNYEIVQLLLAHPSININERDADFRSYTALEYAENRWDVDEKIIQLLKKGKLSTLPATATSSASGNLSQEDALHWVNWHIETSPVNNLSYMRDSYESVARNLNTGDDMGIERIIQEQQTYINRWVERKFEVIDFAIGARRIEIRCRYTCTNAKGKSVNGYSKTTLIISSHGRIEAFGDNSSSKSIPAFSEHVGTPQTLK